MKGNESESFIMWKQKSVKLNMMKEKIFLQLWLRFINEFVIRYVHIYRLFDIRFVGIRFIVKVKIRFLIDCNFFQLGWGVDFVYKEWRWDIQWILRLKPQNDGNCKKLAFNRYIHTIDGRFIFYSLGKWKIKFRFWFLL